ncbi:hypothetical protein MPC4_920001 [Methylocella tundrae]|uniref:Uncharacterized protein n=1 Tax=Methylocella tundrae TaxID=227605 RepID=A0A8B6MDC3_METTU|nr:hypothetical protein MPC4_920001 [Methylocella tundrae]
MCRKSWSSLDYAEVGNGPGTFHSSKIFDLSIAHTNIVEMIKNIQNVANSAITPLQAPACLP